MAPGREERDNGAGDGGRQTEPGPPGDLSGLNGSRLILDLIGRSLLSNLANDLLDLLATSVAVYEKNGDYAFGLCTSGWCRFASRASRERCGPVDDRQALASGGWLCHESCWKDAARPSIESGAPVEAACRGGIRLYAVPIRAGSEIVGSITIGYGDPPRDAETLRALAATLGAGFEELRLVAAAHEPRPPSVVALGRKRVHYAAHLIGETVERRRAEEALRRTTETLRAVFQASPVAITVIDTASRLTMWNLAAERMFGWNEREVLGKVLPITPPGGRDEHVGFREKAVRGESVTAAQVKRMRKDGALIDVELSTAPFRDSKGAVCGVVGVLNDISERTRAEAVLRESEQRFRTLAEATFEGISLSESGVILDVNDQLAEMLGWPRRELIGRPVLEFVAPGHRHVVADSLRHSLTGPYEHLLLRRDGTTVPVEIRARVLAAGDRCLRLTAIRDITERIRAEEALRQLSRADEEALRVARMGHWEYDVADGMFTFNDRYYALHGVTAGDVGGYRMSAERFARDFVPPDYSDTVGDAIRQAMETADPGFQLQFEGRILRAGGEARWVTVWFRIEKDAQGRTTRLYGVNQDITERKHAEERLRFTQYAIDRSGEAAIWTGPDGRVTYANDATCRSLDYTRDEMLTLKVSDFSPDLPPETWTAHWEDIKRRGSATFETRHRDRSGRVFPVEARVNFVEFEGREYRCAFVRDLSERRKAEEERQRLEDRMREVQKLESLGVLAGGIAHDFNNLLMAILGNADLALHALAPESRARPNVEEIERASKRAADLCRQMLAYSGKGRFVVGRFDLSEIVREMARILEISISKMATLRYALAADLPPVRVDVTQMRQVVMNLITNASEALGVAAGAISVSTGVAECDRDCLSDSYLDDNLPGGRYVFLEVSDTGCGMDGDTRRRIFDPFFTTKFAGRGLGLAAVLGIVRGHKGAIKVSSEPGKGASFRILLPAAEWAPGDREPAAEAAPRPPGGGTVLLVDDDAHVRSVGSEMLEMLRFKVLTATNGREGVELFRARGDEIALVILDLTMPEMSGEEAFRAIRGHRCGVHVLLSSGYGEQDACSRFAAAGVSGFIQKPYTVAMLREALGRILG